LVSVTNSPDEHERDHADHRIAHVPTVRFGDRLFWGNDRLEEAAATIGV
jgi:hypothetical protein